MTDKTLFIEKGAGLSFRIKNLSEDIKTEADKTGMMIVRNVPSTILNKKNANGRSYATNTMQEALKENISKGLYESRSLLCTADDHPETTYPKPIDASHVVIDTKIVQENGNDILLNDWLILPTVNGKNLRGLIEAGVTAGTSIRGLGRQNESTGEIEDYEYLGTDVVGNPSAGTYASFNNLNESIIVESVSQEFCESVKNTLELPTIKENNKSEEDTKNMFKLEDAISAFKSKYKEGQISSDAISDLLTIEMNVIQNNADTEVFEEFKESILGAISYKEESNDEDKINKAEEAKDEDTLNKAQRHLEASEIVASQLREQNEQLMEEIKALKKYKESSGKLIGELTNRVKVALEDVKLREASIEENEEKLVESIKTAAIKMGKDLQAEAKEAIQQLETRLEQTIQMGDITTKYFFASKSVTEALVNRIKKQLEKNKKEEEVLSISESVVKNQKSTKEPRQPGWK